jgi:type IV pilus assembly protein PilE
VRSLRQSVSAAGFPRAQVSRLAHGFTLIEMMIVVVILGILGAVVYPSYADYVARSNRAATQAFMLEVSSTQERYQLDSRAYATGVGALGTLGFSTLPSQVTDHYTLSIDPVTGPPAGYAIRAVPGGAQAARDAACGTLTLTHTGARQVSGTRTDCWQ